MILNWLPYVAIRQEDSHYTDHALQVPVHEDKPEQIDNWDNEH